MCLVRLDTIPDRLLWYDKWTRGELDHNLVDDVIEVVWRKSVILLMLGPSSHQDGVILRGRGVAVPALASQGLQLILWCLGLEQDK